MMNRLINPIIFIICLFVTACSDDNNENEPITPFSLGNTYYEVRLGKGTNSIYITNGSGDISLAIEDENILNAKYESGLYADGLRGVIFLYGMRKGSTTLTITDNITKEAETVEVKVVDCYLAYDIGYSNHPVLKTGTRLFWVNNQTRDYYLFAESDTHNQPLVKGSYDFFMTSDIDTGSSPQLYGIPHLCLNYPSDEDGNLADANIAATPHDFQIELYGENASSSLVTNVIRTYLGVDWEKLIGDAQTKSLAPADMTMIMTVPGTDYQIEGELSTVTIPEHILD